MTDIHDLRTFIDALEDTGQLARVSQPVSMQHELADVGAALERAGAAAVGLVGLGSRLGGTEMAEYLSDGALHLET